MKPTALSLEGPSFKRYRSLMILVLRILTLIWSQTNLDHDTMGEGQDIHHITSASAILMEA